MSGDEEVQSPRVGRAAAPKPAPKAAPKAPAKKSAPAKAAARDDDVEVETRRAPEHKESSDPTDNPELLTRRSRTVGSGNKLDIPQHRMKPGWDYEWKTETVMGMKVDDSETAEVHESGWRAVPPKDFPEMIPPDFKGKVIRRLGQVLMMRPMTLTLEARAEDYRLAETQKHDKLMAASAIPIEKRGAMNALAPEITIEGVVGAHRAKPAA